MSAHAESRVFHLAFRRTEQFYEHCSYSFKGVSGDFHPQKRKGTCESLSELRSDRLQQVNINVVRLSLNEKGLSWLLTCAAFHLSQDAGAFGSKAVSLLVSLSAFSRATSARYWFVLCSSLRADIGNMSIQESFKRFKSHEHCPVHLTISTFPLLARVI